MQYQAEQVRKFQFAEAAPCGTVGQRGMDFKPE